MLTKTQITANAYALNFADDLRIWVREHLFSDFTLAVELDWKPSRRSSRGGMYKNGPGINMAMYWSFPDNKSEVYLFNEYPSYHNDKDIGGFYATDPYLKLRALIAHEVAHAIQYHSYKVLGNRCKPHGPVFKSYYKMLRDRFVNHLIPEQKPLAEEYNNYVRVLNKRFSSY